MTTGEKTRALVEWAFFTLLIAVIGLAGLSLPLLYFIVAVFLPLPVILLVLRLDIRYGFLGLAVSGTMLALVASPQSVLVLMMHYGLLGILYGVLFKNRVPSGVNIASGLLGASVLGLSSVSLIFAFTGENPFVLGNEGRGMVEQWLAANQSAGAFDGMPPDWQNNFRENMITLFEMFIPGQLIITSAAAAGITYFLARVNLRRLGFPLPPAPAFTRMSFPWYSIWALITGLGLTLAGDHFSLPLAAKLGKNVLFILFYIYLALGLSVAAYFYRNIKLARAVKIILLLLAAAYFPFSVSVIILLGVVDPLVNFRRLPAAKE